MGGARLKGLFAGKPCSYSFASSTDLAHDIEL